MFSLFKKDKIGEPPWNYNFLVNLQEGEYPKYLAKFFKYRTGEKLPLRFDFKQQAWVIDKKRCKTFNQKLQWIKLYGVTDLMRKCTDKVAVRDYVAEKIGSEYLKPVLQIIPDNKETGCALICPPCGESTFGSRIKGVQNDVSTYFDQIHWDKLPNAFVIKCNHGCKWQYIIKDKKNFLNTPQLFETVKRNITGWLEQEYFPWNGFELNYKGIKSKILIEPLMSDNIKSRERNNVNVFCFNGLPKLIIKLNAGITVYDKTLNITENILENVEKVVNIKADNIIKQILDLSKKLSKDFLFVRIDWMIYQNKPYFEEFTFTPDSGFSSFSARENNKLGKLLNIK